MLRETVVVLTLLAFADGQTNSIVDLTNAIPRNRIHEPDTVSASGGQSGGDVGTSQRVSFLKIDILSATIAKSDEEPALIFDVLLRNSGDSRIKVPIDPNLADFEPVHTNNPSYSYLSLDVFVKIEHTDEIVRGILLYGSEKIAGSMHELLPGESVRVRARTPYRPKSRSTANKPLVTPSVRAGFLMQQNLVNTRGGMLHQDSRQIAPQVTSDDVVTLAVVTASIP